MTKPPERSDPTGTFFVAVALGAVIGSLARWGVSVWVPDGPEAAAGNWPWATFLVNLLGCAVIGVVLTLWAEGPTPRPWVRPFLAVGVVGGFTTFSAFALEGARLTDDGRAGLAAAYATTSVIAGVLLVAAGSRLTRRWLLRSRWGGRP